MTDFEPIDMKTWANAQEFHYYTDMAPTSYTVNVTVDVTQTRNFLKSKGLKSFPTYLYVVTKAINKQEQMRVGLKDNVLGHYKTLTPAYPQFHEDDKTTSLLFTSYDDDFNVFYDRYIYDINSYGDSHGILSSKGLPPANTYIISCIPWFSFESFCVHNHGIKNYYFPTFESCKFREENGRTIMPLSITVHHATTDGYHIYEFIKNIQNDFNSPEKWAK